MHFDQNASPPRVEVIIQRRRRWPTAEKIRLVEETMQPDVGVLRGPASGRRSQLAVQLASTNAGRRPASGPG
jgi:transposase-like protein